MLTYGTLDVRYSFAIMAANAAHKQGAAVRVFDRAPAHLMRRLLTLAAIGCAMVAAASWYAAGQLIRPAPAKVGALPADLAGRDVAFAGASGVLRGWYLPGTPGQGAVLLLHGIRSNRIGMLSRARALRRHGYGVLLIDLQAHGESEGVAITAGAREALDAATALKFLRQEAAGERVGALGVSLGGASLLLAQHEQAPDALVIESVYASVEDAFRNRIAMRFGENATPLAQLLLWQMPLRIDVDPRQLRPLQRIGTLAAPLLIVHGGRDRHTKLDEAHALYAAAREPKELWVIADAAHVDFHRALGAVYERRVLAFFDAHLRGQH